MRPSRTTAGLRGTLLALAAWTVLAVAALTVPTGAAAQDHGFLVLPGIPGGSAVVSVDGRSVGTLGETELTLEVAAGEHAVRVVKAGVVLYAGTIVIRPDDVSFLRVDVGVPTVRLRLVHLEPARVDVRLEGELIALTPATLSVPVGEAILQVGGEVFCLVFSEGSEAYVRIRSGGIDELRGSEICPSDRGEAYEGPHGLLSRADFRRRRLWVRDDSGSGSDDFWSPLSATFSHDGRLVLMSFRPGRVVLWDNHTGEEVRRFMTRDPVWDAALSPNGERVLARFYFDADEPALLDSHTGAETRRFQLEDQAGPVAFSFDGRFLLLGSPFGYVVLLDADTGAELRRFPTLGRVTESGSQPLHPTSVSFSPDGRRLLATIQESSELIIWDVETGEEQLRFATNLRVDDAAFSPDGQFVLTANAAPARSDDSAEVIIWDAETGAEIQHFPTSSDVTMVAFSPDARYLLTSSFNELVVWTLFSGG